MTVKVKITKPVLVFVMAGGLVLLVAAVSMFNYLNKRIASETYDAAIVADDAGHEEKAIKLFEEACGEGSELACRAIRESRTGREGRSNNPVRQSPQTPAPSN